MKKLVCVKYPGYVENAENAVATLGGLDKLCETYYTTDSKATRLELRFRPKDVFCKGVFGDRVEKRGLVLKVRKSRGEDGTPRHSVEVVGLVETVYKFDAMCDFQYLPVLTFQGEKKAESFHEKISLDRWRSPDEFFNPQSLPDPLYFPPTIFSRLDRPTNYNFRDRTTTTLSLDDAGEPVTQQPLRQRAIGSQLLHYGAKDVPTEASAPAMDLFSSLPDPIKPQVDVLKKLFQERPVWSKMAIAEETKLTQRPLKFLLPVVAYYFLSGPWRYCWVRFGYDPRKDPSARNYQVVDFRTRRSLRERVLMSKGEPPKEIARIPLPKFAGAAIRKARTPASKAKANKLFDDSTTEEPCLLTLGTAERVSVITESGMAVMRMQFLYQACDIHLPEVHRYLEVEPETECKEADGFFPPGVILALRTLIQEHLNKLIKKHRVDLTLESDADESNESEGDHAEQSDGSDDD